MTTTTAAEIAPQITAGTPATILLYTDTRAAVVTRRTAKRVWIARVETGAETTENEAEVQMGGCPVRRADGILDKPLGAGEQYTLHVDQDGTPWATRGDRSIRVVFGHSVTRVDYRY